MTGWQWPGPRVWGKRSWEGLRVWEAKVGTLVGDGRTLLTGPPAQLRGPGFTQGR